MLVSVTTFVQTLLNGLVIAGIVALAAVGLTLSYGVTRFINFAYGDYMAYGAFITWGLHVVGVPLLAAMVVAILVLAALGVALSETLFEPIRDRGPIPLLLTSIGLAFVMQNALRGVVGAAGKSFRLPLLRPLQLGELYFPKLNAVIIAVALVTLLVVHSTLRYTMFGRKMRAISGNRRLADISGIDSETVTRRMWMVSAGIAGLSGIMLGMYVSPFRPIFGWSYLLVVFSAVILGGIGRPYGAMLGALIIGMTMSFGSQYLSSGYTLAYAFLVLVVTMLVRPEGIIAGEISGEEI